MACISSGSGDETGRSGSRSDGTVSEVGSIVKSRKGNCVLSINEFEVYVLWGSCFSLTYLLFQFLYKNKKRAPVF